MLEGVLEAFAEAVVADLRLGLGGREFGIAEDELVDDAAAAVGGGGVSDVEVDAGVGGDGDEGVGFGVVADGPGEDDGGGYRGCRCELRDERPELDCTSPPAPPLTTWEGGDCDDAVLSQKGIATSGRRRAGPRTRDA